MNLSIIRGKLIALFAFVLYSSLCFSNSKPSDSTSVHLKELSANKYELGSFRSFESLNAIAMDESLVRTDVFTQDAFEDTTITATIANYRARAEAVFEEVKSLQRYVDFLDETSLLELPVGINKTIGNVDYTILIDSMLLKPDAAYLTVYMKLDLPSDDKSIAFRGSGIKFSKYGGISADARLELVGDYAIDFNEQTALILKGDGDTYVEFDCDGFQGMGIDADIVFSRDFIVPDTPDGTPGEGRVTSSFTTSLTDWNDFLVELSLPNFQINGVDGLGFSINNAVFDFSDYRNATSVVFPQDYLSNTGFGENTNAWRGFYMKHLSIALPPHFKKSASSERMTFSASDMIIDKSGFTGLLEAENLIALNEGDVSGWAFSLDRIHIKFLSSQIQEGGFEGEIVIPISDENRTFAYDALISHNNEYQLTVITTETMEFPMFSTSEVKLFPNTSVEIKLEDGKFLPKANLYGEMNIVSKIGKKELMLADIEFQNLQIQTVKPHLSADYFSFGTEAAQQAMAGFPIQIERIGFRNVDEEKVALDVGVAVNVSESFSGSSEIAIIAKEVPEKRIKWQLHEVEVNKIALDIETASFGFKGSLIFYRNDAIYGDGFNGQIEANFKSLNLIVEAGAIFGSVDDYRYWYVDAAVSLPTGIPIGPGLEITGFGGGAYNRMGIDMTGGSELGMTRSGVIYAPKKTNGLGLKASVNFAATGGGAFNGNAAFEIAFFEGGGVRYISFKGNAYFMTPPMGGTLAEITDKAKKLGDAVSKLEKAAGNVPGAGLIAENNTEDQTLTNIYGQIGAAAGKEGAVSAHVFIAMDFENRTFYGNFEVYINVAGGIIQGVGEGGRAGWAELYFGPDDWYIYVGTPTDRIGVTAGIGPIRASLTSYFMLGTSIPGSPPPPDEVSEILGGIDLDYMSDLNELGNGAGIGFGAALSVDTGDLTFLMFYARFKAGAGFDVMLKDYGNTKCQGQDDRIGVNGWYANGQAYAYFDGAIGISVKIFGKRKKVEILSIGAAAVLQAKLPNPFWMRGVVGGRFSVLGGLVKGNCAFEVTLGKECELVQDGSIMESIRVIADVSPVDGSSDVSVFATPQAVFNLAVNEEFEMVDIDEKLKKFRIKIDFFRTKDGAYTLPGAYELNFDNNVAAYDSHDIFPPKKKLTSEVQVSFEEYKDGRWQAVIVEGKKYVEYMKTTFTSGEAPDYIPLENVLYSYPVVNQLNFYKDEYLSGYIVLDKGQPYLFEPSSEWTQKGRFANVTSGDAKYFDFGYSSGNKEVAFNIPKNLATDQIYTFELVNLPANDAGAIDRNIKVDSSQVIGDGNTKIVARQAEGAISELQEKNVFNTHFRTSKYTTFKNKIRAQTITRTSREIFFLWEGLYINNQVTSDEAFSQEELTGNKYTPPMVRLEADMNGNNYFEKSINPLIYDGYPLDGNIRLTNRPEDSLGIVPVRAVQIWQNSNLSLNEDDIAIGRFTYPVQSIRIQYLPAPYMYFDFIDLQAQVAQRYINSGSYSDRISKLIWGQFPIHNEGTYNIDAAYYLPGKKSPSDVIKINTVYTQE